jgi:transcription elongation factor GreA
MEYLSKERYDQIVAELNHLINVEYPRIKDDLSEARAQGDLSENCGYRAARRAQGKAISRIRFLQKILEYSRVLDPALLPKDKVSLLSKVEFTNLATDSTMSFTIVSPHEMNLQEGKISCNSPIGKALMGKKVGDTADVAAPSGTFQIRIDKISTGQ